MSIMSNTHDFSIISEAYFNPCCQILASFDSLETIFFKSLYESQNKEEILFFESQGKKLTFESSKEDFMDLELGRKFKLSYHSSENREDEVVMHKEITVLKNVEGKDTRELRYYIKEKLMDDILKNQYEIRLEILKQDKGVLIYGKIIFHPSITLPSPFNKTFKRAFHLRLLENSTKEIYKCNYQSTTILTVKASKRKTFEMFTAFIDELSEDKDKMNGLNNEVKAKMNGESVRFKYECAGNRLVFEAKKFDDPHNSDEDSYLYGKLIDSQPKCIPYTYKYHFKSVNENTTMLIVTYEFLKRLNPTTMKIVMNQHIEELKNTVCYIEARKNYKAEMKV